MWACAFTTTRQESWAPAPMLHLAAPEPFVDVRETWSSVECARRLPSLPGASGSGSIRRQKETLPDAHRPDGLPSAAVDAGHERCGRAFGARLAVRVPGERSNPFVFAQHVRASKARLHRRWRPLPTVDAAFRSHSRRGCRIYRAAALKRDRCHSQPTTPPRATAPPPMSPTGACSTTPVRSPRWSTTSARNIAMPISSEHDQRPAERRRFDRCTSGSENKPMLDLL